MGEKDYGIKVSKEGFDVRTCADKDLLFSSAFPSLNILFEGVKIVNNIAFDPPEIIFSHNLGDFYAFAVYVLDDNMRLSVSGVLDSLISCDKNSIYWEGGRISGQQTVYYQVFNWKLQTEYLSTVNKNVSSIGELNKDFGIKISKEGHDVLTCELKDQILNSGGRTPMIHQSGSGRQAAFANATITHNLGYVPLFLSYTNQYIFGGGPYPDVSKYYFRAPYDIEVPSLGISGQDNITKSTLTLNSPVAGLDYAYIIFKDPTETL